MYTPLRTLAIAAALAARYALAAELTVLTPTLVQCENSTVQFSGGNPNYMVSVVPSSDPCSDSLISIPQTGRTSVNFLVTLPAGTSVEVVVDDADGNEGWSATTTVQAGKDSSCLSKAATGSSSSSVSKASPSSTASSASTTPSSSSSVVSSANSGSGSSASWSPPPAVQSGTIGTTTNTSGDPVNVGSDPNTSGSVSRATLSVGSLIASALFMLAASQL